MGRYGRKGPTLCLKCRRDMQSCKRTGPDGYGTLCTRCFRQYRDFKLPVYYDSTTKRYTITKGAHSKPYVVVGFSWRGDRRGRDLRRPILYERRKTAKRTSFLMNKRAVNSVGASTPGRHFTGNIRINPAHNSVQQSLGLQGSAIRSEKIDLEQDQSMVSDDEVTEVKGTQSKSRDEEFLLEESKQVSVSNVEGRPRRIKRVTFQDEVRNDSERFSSPWPQQEAIVAPIVPETRYFSNEDDHPIDELQRRRKSSLSRESELDQEAENDETETAEAGRSTVKRAAENKRKEIAVDPFSLQKMRESEYTSIDVDAHSMPKLQELPDEEGNESSVAMKRTQERKQMIAETESEVLCWPTSALRISLKGCLEYQGDKVMRRFSIPENVTFREFQAWLLRIFHVPISVMKYKDDKGDVITMSSGNELREMFSLSKQLSLSPILLHLYAD